MQGEVRSFVVRIWSEAVDAERETVTWRGTVEDVLSGDHLHFQNFDALQRFIQDCSESSSTDEAYEDEEGVPRET